jgi:ferritin
MRVPDSLRDAMAAHAAHEYANAFIYLDLFNYFESVSLTGFSAWAWKQYEGELEHGAKFITFLNDALATFRMITIPPVPGPEISGPDDALNRAYLREADTTQRIYDLRDLAQKVNHQGAFTFLEWFVNEQIEEEKTTNDILNLIRLSANTPAALLQLDDRLKDGEL